MKIITILIFAFTLFSPYSNNKVYMENLSEIYSISTTLYQDDVENKVSIFGYQNSNSPYVTNIEIRIYENDILLYTLTPRTNYGYNPSLLSLDFIGNGLNQIFYSADSGGSGGYGFYYLYDLKKSTFETLFDYEEYSAENVYTGKFINDFRAVIQGTNQNYHLDVSTMDKYYKNIIYSPNGVPKITEIDIGPVNTVFPIYNSSLNRWLIQVYQKATAVAQVNVLGYVVNNLIFNNGQFEKIWNSFNITN